MKHSILLLAATAALALAALACDLEVPAMPMVGEEAGGGAQEGGESNPVAEDTAPPDPPSAYQQIGMMLLSLGPVGLVAVVAVLIALWIRGRKT